MHALSLTYNWDYEDRLTSISGTSVQNIYNGLDQRIDRVRTSSTNFAYSCDGADPGDPVLCDGQDVYTPGLSQTAISTNGTSFYVLDRLGSSTRMLGPGQGVTDSQVFDAFGNSQAADRIGTTWPVAFGYGAKSNYQTDQDTGLQLLGHRFYDPTIGRFLSRDPVHDGTNDYAYVENNPVDAVDPTGEVMFGTVDLDAMAASMAGGGDNSDDIIMDIGKEADQKNSNTAENSNGGGGGAHDPTVCYAAASESAAAGTIVSNAENWANTKSGKAEYYKMEPTWDRGTDCGVFVWHCVQEIDPHYPERTTWIQLAYLKDPKHGWTTGKIGQNGPRAGDVLI